MKKMFLFAAAMVIASVGFSQVRYGIQVIGNASNPSIKNAEIPNFKKSMQIGFGAGLVADIPVAKNFSVRPSLNFLQKKGQIEFAIPAAAGKTSTVKTNLNYLELPVNFVYTIPMQGAKVYFGAGPSFGYGISGTARFKGWGVDEETEEVVPVDQSSDAFKKVDAGGAGFKRFDIGANVNAGLQFNNGLYVNAGYLAGLSNLVEKGDGNYKNQGILLTVGFLLPSGK